MNTIIGNREDPWPYEYLINALIYFSMSIEEIRDYIVPDFPKTLFHGAEGDWYASDCLKTISFIYAEVISVGRSIDSWIEDEAIEKLSLEPKFVNLYDLVYDKENHELMTLWLRISSLAGELLDTLGWQERPESPFYSCDAILDEWSYGEYSKNKNQV